MADNRWGKRFPTKIPVRFGEETFDYPGMVQDLSVFGFFVVTNRSYPIDTTLVLELTTRDQKTIKVIGTVRWNKERPQTSVWLMRDSGLGIRIKTFLEGQQHYENLCQQLCKDCAQGIKSTCPMNAEDEETRSFSFMRKFFSKKD